MKHTILTQLLHTVDTAKLLNLYLSALFPVQQQQKKTQ